MYTRTAFHSRNTWAAIHSAALAPPAEAALVSLATWQALGHRQITTTEVYTKVSDEALRTAVRGG